MINASMQQPLRFIFSFTTLIQLANHSLRDRKGLWDTTRLCPSTLIIIVTEAKTEGLRVLLIAEDATDSGFTPTIEPVEECPPPSVEECPPLSSPLLQCCYYQWWLFFRPLSLQVFAKRSLRVWFLPKRHYCVSQAPGLCHPMSAHFPFWRICGGAQQTPDLPQAQTQQSIRLTHVEVLRVIFKKCSIVSCKCKKTLLFSLSRAFWQTLNGLRSKCFRPRAFMHFQGVQVVILKMSPKSGCGPQTMEWPPSAC